MRGIDLPRSACHRATLPALALALALAGCAAGAPPAASGSTTADATPTRWSEGGATQAQSPTSLARWWQRLGDAELNRLIEDALANSPTVHSAIAALRQSRALADVAAASLMPRLGATGGPSAATCRPSARPTPSASAASA